MAKQQPSNRHYHDASIYIGGGMVLGTSFGLLGGVIIGAVTDTIILAIWAGIAIGTPMGMAIGTVLSWKGKSSGGE